MKMTRERKWLGAILGLGVGALVLDQTLLGEPESANAQEGADLVDSATSELLVTPDGLAGSVVQDTSVEAGATDLSDFASRLEAVGSLSQGQPNTRDAFALPDHWDSRPTEARPDNLSEEPTNTEVQAFLSNHVLVGTIESATGNYAILEGERAPVNIRVGQVVGGFVLIKVEDRATAWESESSGQRAVLRVILPELP